MPALLFVSEDASLMVQSLDGLEGAGLQVTWKAAREAAPAQQKQVPDVVVLDGDTNGLNVVDLGKAWRAVDPAPALAVVSTSPAGERAAQALAVPFVRKPFDPAVFGAQLKRAAEVRFVGALSPGAALRALGQKPSGDGEQDAVVVLGGKARVDFAMVRDAMRPFADAYVTIHPAGLEALREHRVLSIPETNLALTLDGARTLRTVCQAGEVEPQAALRLIWALASVAIASITQEPPDDGAHPAARLVARARRRLRARGAWVQKARSHFDLLELPPDPDTAHADVELALRHLAVWYQAERLAQLDLGDLAATVEPYWQQMLKARATLTDPATCRRYFFWAIEQGVDLQGGAAERRQARADAEQWFARGQQALIAGDAFKAVSSLAQAARLVPDEPDYEAYAAWGRYMAELARGNDTRPAVVGGLAHLDRALLGRKPRPRALHAMGLLAQVAGDLDMARIHLGEAIACDPQNTGAQRALARLQYGGRTPPPEKR